MPWEVDITGYSTRIPVRSERIYSIQSAYKCARCEFKLYIFTEVYDITLVCAWRRWAAQIHEWMFRSKVNFNGFPLLSSRLAVNRGSRLDFTPRPTLFFPPCWLLLSRLIYWRDSFCTALQTRKLWIWSTGLSARLTPSSQREVWVLGNLFVLTGRSRPDIRGMRGRSGKSYVWRPFPWRTLRISTFSAPW